METAFEPPLRMVHKANRSEIMDFQFFSADDHVDLRFLPPDLWEKRVPSRFRERAPRVVDTPQGQYWMANGEQFSSVPTSHQAETIGNKFTPVDHVPGRWRPTTPELRLADMDLDGVESQVLYGGLIVGFQQKDPELNGVCMRAYNEWISEFCQHSPKRFIGLGFLPVHDASAAVAELYRCAELKLRGVQFQPFDAYQPVWHPVWEPLWAAAAETKISVSFHTGAGQWTMPLHDTHLPGVPKNRGAYASGATVLPIQLDEVLTAIVLSGALMRHPALHIVLGESSIGWIPFVLDRMDRKYEECSGGRHPRYDAVLKEIPSYYWNRQGHATFQNDPVGIHLLKFLGAHTVMWGSDYPHVDGVWPHSHETAEENFKGVDPAIAKMILRDNARQLYAI